MAARTRVRRDLAALAPEARARAGVLAARRAALLPEVRSATHLLVFRSLADEVPTEALLAEALARGQRVFAPRVAGDRLEFFRVSAATIWRAERHGVLEPEASEPLGAKAIDRRSSVILVPGLAFAPDGTRLGRGGGHYDRTLASAPLAGRVFAVGLALDVQVRPVPTEPHDARVRVIVTESRTLRIEEGRST